MTTPAPASVRLRWPLAGAATALFLLPVTGLLWIFTPTGRSHAHDTLCMALAAVQFAVGAGSAVGLFRASLRATRFARSAGLMALVMGCVLVSLGGLLALGVVYLGSLDTAGVGARFN